VAGTIRRDKRVKPLLPTYFDFKDGLEKDRGIEYGFDYLPVYQVASESPGERHAADGVVRLYARWEAVSRGTKKNGALVGKIEYRHRLDTDVSPQELGLEIGYAGLTTVSFGDIGWTLPNLYWEQHLAEDRVSFVAGIVDVTDYVDTYALNDSLTQFFNQAFATNSTIPAPGQGLGASARGSIGRHLYLVAGIADGGGALWERSLSAGPGYFPRGARDLLGVGLNRGRPSEDTFASGLEDQYTLEVFYRWRPLRLLTISPDLQLLFDPGLNPDEDLVAVLGVRVRLALCRDRSLPRTGVHGGVHTPRTVEHSL